MKTTKLIKSVAIAALLASGSAYAAPLELLSNGSFEDTVIANNSWSIYSSLDGWSSGRGRGACYTTAGQDQTHNNKN